MIFETRRMSRRRLLLAAGLGAAGTVLLACQPAVPASPQATEAPAREGGTKAPEPTAAPSGKQPVTITYADASVTDAEIKGMDPVYLKFNDIQSDVKVEVLHGYDEAKLLSAVSAGSPVDVYWRWAVESYGSWIAKGIIQNLDAYVQASSLDLKRYIPISIELVKWKEKFYGMPLTSACITMIWWNKAIFEEVGLDPEVPPKTWDEFLQFADKIDKVDGSGNLVRAGFVSQYPWGGGCYRLPIIFGGKFWDPATEKLTPTHSGVVNGMQFEADLYKHVGVDAMDRFVASMGEVSSNANPFFTGTVGMVMCDEWQQLFIQAFAPDLRYGFARLPQDPNHPEFSHPGQGMIALVIPTGAPRPAEGWTFIEYLQTKEAAAGIGAALYNVAQVTDAIEVPAYANIPILKFASEYGADNLYAYPANLPIAGEYATELEKARDLIVHGKQTAQEGMQAVYDMVQPLLEQALG